MYDVVYMVKGERLPVGRKLCLIHLAELKKAEALGAVSGVDVKDVSHVRS